MADHSVNILVQGDIEKDPELPDVPRALDYVKDPIDRQVAELYYTMKGVARPILAGPQGAARAGRGAAPGFRRDEQGSGVSSPMRQKLRLDLHPTPAKSITDFVAMMTSASPEVDQAHHRDPQPGRAPANRTVAASAEPAQGRAGEEHDSEQKAIGDERPGGEPLEHAQAGPRSRKTPKSRRR